MALLTEKHPNVDFFVADIYDQTPFKDDIASMEHPVFTLATKPDLRTIEYRNGNIEIDINPHFKLGLPTIFDKDLLLYSASLLMLEVNAGRTPPRTIRISPHDFFISTNRHADNKIGGNNYILLKKSLERLSGCRIKTNIKTNGRDVTEGFGVLDSYRIIESHKVKNRTIRLEIVVSEWFYNSIVGREMLTINREYFRLRKPLERRLYEIARKHCGSQKEWSITLPNLFMKSGSSGTLAKFKFNLKAIIKDNYIPDYRYFLDSNDKVTIFKKDYVEPVKLAPDANLHDRAFHILSQLKKSTRTNAKKIHEESYTDWSMQEIAVQYVQYMEKTGTPKTLDGAFLGFLKRKVKTFKKDAVTS